MQEKQNKKFLIKYILFLIVSSCLIGVIVYLVRPNEIKVLYPYKVNLMPTEAYACEALTGTYMYADKDEGVVSKTFKGTDKIAIKIKGNKLKFLTRASVEIGNAEADEWQIIKNEKNNLVAVLSGLDQPLGDINIFMLNKQNGIGIWSKTEQNLVLSENPGTQAYQLICR